MSDEHAIDAPLTDAELDQVAGGGADTATHWGCGLSRTQGDASHSNQIKGHQKMVSNTFYVCYGTGWAPLKMP